MEWHPDYHTWVLRAYTEHQEDPVVYIRVDTGEPLPRQAFFRVLTGVLRPVELRERPWSDA